MNDSLSRLFSIDDLENAKLNLCDLNNKILKIIIVENEELTIIAGQDINTDKIYIINVEMKNNNY